jgi:hypothetical protein
LSAEGKNGGQVLPFASQVGQGQKTEKFIKNQEKTTKMESNRSSLRIKANQNTV